MLTPTDDSDIYLRECLDTLLQKFESRADGVIQLAEAGVESFWMGVLAGEGRVINPIHKHRELVVHTCDGTESNLITWSFSPVTSAQESQLAACQSTSILRSSICSWSTNSHCMESRNSRSRYHPRRRGSIIRFRIVKKTYVVP
jgi:hypothetical protein